MPKMPMLVMLVTFLGFNWITSGLMFEIQRFHGSFYPYVPVTAVTVYESHFFCFPVILICSNLFKIQLFLFNIISAFILYLFLANNSTWAVVFICIFCTASGMYAADFGISEGWQG